MLLAPRLSRLSDPHAARHTPATLDPMIAFPGVARLPMARIATAIATQRVKLWRQSRNCCSTWITRATEYLFKYVPSLNVISLDPESQSEVATPIDLSDSRPACRSCQDYPCAPEGLPLATWSDGPLPLLLHLQKMTVLGVKRTQPKFMIMRPSDPGLARASPASCLPWNPG